MDNWNVSFMTLKKNASETFRRPISGNLPGLIFCSLNFSPIWSKSRELRWMHREYISSALYKQNTWNPDHIHSKVPSVLHACRSWFRKGILRKCVNKLETIITSIRKNFLVYQNIYTYSCQSQFCYLNAVPQPLYTTLSFLLSFTTQLWTWTVPVSSSRSSKTFSSDRLLCIAFKSLWLVTSFLKVEM